MRLEEGEGIKALMDCKDCSYIVLSWKFNSCLKFTVSLIKNTIGIVYFL